MGKRVWYLAEEGQRYVSVPMGKRHKRTLGHWSPQRGFSDARIKACISKDHAPSVPTRREILSALFLLLASKAGWLHKPLSDYPFEILDIH